MTWYTPYLRTWMDLVEEPALLVTQHIVQTGRYTSTHGRSPAERAPPLRSSSSGAAPRYDADAPRGTSDTDTRREDNRTA